jgi:uncharacterized protein (TIGR02001 family)
MLALQWQEPRGPAPARARWRTIRLPCCIERAIRRAALALASGLIAGNALAQFSGSLSFVTDYRYRGVSLSGGHPAVQASLAYDDPSGLYAGVFASNVEFAISPRRELQAVPYAGYVRRFASGLSAEVGAEYVAFTGPGSYDYAELYVGITGDQMSARLYYAPSYFGRDDGAFYLELNGVQPLTDRIRAVAHVGILFNRSDYPLYGPTDRRFVDGRLGIALDIESFTLQASWVGAGSSNTGYPISHNRRNTAVVTLSRTF